MANDIDLLKSHIDAYTRKDGTMVQAHDDKRSAKLPSLGAHASHLRAEGDKRGKEGGSTGDGDKAAFHSLADSLESGDHASAGATLKHMDTEPRDVALNHIHPEHWGKLGMQHINKDRAQKEYDKRHGSGSAGTQQTGASYAKPAHVKTQADEYDHLSKLPADQRTPEMKARMKKIAVTASVGKHSPEYKAHIAGAAKGATSGVQKMKQPNSPQPAAALSFKKDGTADGKKFDNHKVFVGGEHRYTVGRNTVDENSGYSVFDKRDGGVSKHDSKEAAFAHIKGKHAPKAEKKPAAVDVKSGNEGYGYHGEAMHEHIRTKHGEEKGIGSLSEKDYNAATEAGHKKFAEAAGKLVDGGHFGSHDEAKGYLDSKHGRHLHDGATFHDGDINKVAWLKKDVSDYKNAKAKSAKLNGGENG